MNAAQNYTCSSTVNVVGWQLPNNVDYSFCHNLECHIEYCFVPNPPVSLNSNQVIPPAACSWSNTLATTFHLPSGIYGDIPYTVYTEYRVVAGGTPHPSYPASFQITLNTSAPTITLNSPSGLPNGGYATGQQPQFLNARAAQAVTYEDQSVGSPVETVTMSPSGCTASTCTALTSSPLNPPPALSPYLWGWSGSSPSDGYAYLQLTADDQAGEQAMTPPPSSSSIPLIQLFDSTSTGAEQVTCGPPGQTGTVPCLMLADGSESTEIDITGDEPSCETGVPIPQPTPTGDLFCGYSDPSMRGDPFPSSSNLWGTNLWLGYSFPVLHATAPNGSTIYVPTVETHMAESASGGSQPTGLGWAAWCNGCDTFTPIYPSVGFGSDSQNPGSYSSHEVFNFWPAPNYPTGNETWYAAHLMYFVSAAFPKIAYAIQNTGCLVISYAQGSPTNLSWPVGGPQPSDCSGSNLPAGTGIKNRVISYADLAAVAGTPSSPSDLGYCYSWGQPAIMVSSVPTGSLAIYLAVTCFDLNFRGLGSYVLTTSNLNLDWTSFQSAWSLYGEFSYGSILSLPGLPTYSLAPNSLTEFDWALRPDNSIVAIATPAYVTDPPTYTGPPVQYGCLALNFNINAGVGHNPFTTGVSSNVIASVSDADTMGPNSTTEGVGPNGCTYEPTSNTGVVIIRHLQTTSQYQTYSIVGTGVMP